VLCVFLLFSFKCAKLFLCTAEHPGSYKDRVSRHNETAGGKATDTKNPEGPAAGRREAASDELILQCFRKREKFRTMQGSKIQQIGCELLPSKLKHVSMNV
jgi:hypothetical protein